MSVVFAHIAGIPVEETLLALAPAGLLGIGVALRGATVHAARPLRGATVRAARALRRTTAHVTARLPRRGRPRATARTRS
ncbi:hypothetical protein [Conexibacter sp. CPCC 206217]|uniref:hypothetical protein n=1 Tax=Conexibacter sp. CPCC 206217 TaxID=3064574 RepID=UPI00271F9AB9|nr:hypothetical protein [Conexibacter sp. CPCC 206217]MDO8210625.1 hypothetical protein [Conexibacter sp. CPCC 206217]